MVTISDTTPEVGDTLTAEYADGNGTGEPTWQWLADGEPIEDTNNTVYTVTASGLGKTLAARVSFADQDGTIISEATKAVTETTKPTLTGTVTISDTTPEVGDTLTAEYVDGNGTGKATWQWLAADEPIVGANSNTYEVADSDLGKPLVAWVNYAEQSGSKNSKPTAAVATVTFESIDEIRKFLQDQNGLQSDPLHLKITIDLGLPSDPASGWMNLLGALATAGDYVALDLSACTITGNNFNPIGFLDEPFSKDRIVKIALPDMVTAIGDWAFAEYISLTEVNFPKVTSIGNYAFRDCESLIKVNFPKVTSIGNYAFSGCQLAEVSFPEATSIGNYAFYRCYSLAEMSFPESTSIGEFAFQNCVSLTKLSFPKATSIGDSAFEYCTSLTEVSFPKVTSIGKFAFQNCSISSYKSLTEVSFPEVTSIGDSAFSFNPLLTEVSFPKATSIGESAFENCSSLAKMSFPEVTSIGYRAFAYCGSLTEVSFPEATSIDNWVFDNCHFLTEVSIPKVTSIGHAFTQKCISLSTITLGATAPIVDSGIFADTFGYASNNSKVTVKIPVGAIGYDEPGTVFPQIYYEASNYTVNWANGFRGKGWDGSGFTAAGADTPVILVIEEY